MNHRRNAQIKHDNIEVGHFVTTLFQLLPPYVQQQQNNNNNKNRSMNHPPIPPDFRVNPPVWLRWQHVISYNNPIPIAPPQVNHTALPPGYRRPIAPASFNLDSSTNLDSSIAPPIAPPPFNVDLSIAPPSVDSSSVPDSLTAVDSSSIIPPQHFKWPSRLKPSFDLMSLDETSSVMPQPPVPQPLPQTFSSQKQNQKHSSNNTIIGPPPNHQFCYRDYL